MATTAAPAPSTYAPALQTARARLESWLEAERDQLPLWLPVGLGAGIAAWFVLPDPIAWQAAFFGALAVALCALAITRGGRAGVVVAIGGTAFAAGLALVWLRAEMAAAPVLTRPTIARLTARVEAVNTLPARDLVRLRLGDLRWLGRAPAPAPIHVRVNVPDKDVPEGLLPGATIRLRVRLMPPPPPAGCSRRL